MKSALRIACGQSAPMLAGLVFTALLALPGRAEPVSSSVPSVVPAEAAMPGVETRSIYALDTLLPEADARLTTAGAGAEPLDDLEPAEIDRGKVSWYGDRFHGRRTASGERFDMYALTAAHPTLPFGTRIKVRRLDTGQEVEVRINDRGPYAHGRIMDLSRGAAQALGMLQAGSTNVALLPP